MHFDDCIPHSERNSISSILEKVAFSYSRRGYQVSEPSVLVHTTMENHKYEDIPLTHDAKKVVLRFKETRLSDGHWNYERKNFIYYRGFLVPLGTHAYEDGEKSYAIEVKSRESTNMEKFVGQFLPREIVLTRALSEVEVSIFLSGNSKLLGSSHSLFWHDKIHTHFGSYPTREFSNPVEYSHYIGFLFPKDHLINLINIGKSKIGTYNSLHTKKGESDIFPFDFEIVFSRDAFTELIEAYYRWRIASCVDSMKNPNIQSHE